jgi:hypothetical protein
MIMNLQMPVFLVGSVVFLLGYWHPQLAWELSAQRSDLRDGSLSETTWRQGRTQKSRQAGRQTVREHLGGFDFENL